MSIQGASSKKLFGTDGIRGIAGEVPLKVDAVRRLGFYAGQVLHKKFPHQQIRVIGVRDTRESGATLFDALVEGFLAAGIHVYDVGVLSTPSIAYLVHAHRCHSGFVISASHNPPEFNGIKFFNSHGRKWADDWEQNIEDMFAQQIRFLSVSEQDKGMRIPAHFWSQDYADFLNKTLPKQDHKIPLRIALDCSHGANSELGPQIFSNLGADVFALGVQPNGKNINVKCGSQDLRALKNMVLSKKCHLGIAFDGDGDRVIFVDEKGHVVDGDHTLAIFAKNLKAQKKLAGNLVVSTVMANLGLKLALRQWGIKMIETAVGDRHVSEAMKLHGSILGGEQSGHIILGRYLPSGDGLLTALHMAHILLAEKKPLSALASQLKKFPQVLVNVHVKEKKPVHNIPAIHKTIQSIERNLGQQGRVLVRYSGTEPLLRIMIEGPDKNSIQNDANAIAHAVRQHLN